MILKVFAPAKLNLALDVLRRREDGYHDLRMVMQTAGLCDIITMKSASTGLFSIQSSLSFLPAGEKNLALAAARLFHDRTNALPGGLTLTLEKHIPVGAGLGGGSSDAAAVLRGLRDALRPEISDNILAEWSLKLGSDVPFCVIGGTQLAEGRGEVLTPIPPLPPCFIVLAKPASPISTKTAFSLLDAAKIRRRPDIDGMLSAFHNGSLTGVARRLFNVFEEPVSEMIRGIRGIKSTLMTGGALGAVMSGSGTSVFGLFDKEQPARDTASELLKEHREVFVISPYTNPKQT